MDSPHTMGRRHADPGDAPSFLAISPRQAQENRATSAAQRQADNIPVVSCVIPCFNEAENLRKLLPLLCKFLVERFADWEVIVVDDGSDDHTLEVLEYWTGRPGVQALQLSRNFGKEAAISAGLAVARGDVVVLLDGDLQHPPALIDVMFQRWRSGAEIVYAVRKDRENESFWKRVGTRLFYGLLNAGNRFHVPPDAGDFRLMDRAVVNALLTLPERTRFMKGLYAWVGFHAEEIRYTPAARASGQSKFGPLRLLRLSIDGLTGFTTLPLRFVSIVGVAMASLAFLYGGYLVVDYLSYGNTVSGWTTIVACLLLFGGLQMISIGILGEYVARIFEEAKHRPMYIIKRKLGSRFEGHQP